MLHCGIEKGSNFIPFHSHNAALSENQCHDNALWGSTIWPIQWHISSNPTSHALCTSYCTHMLTGRVKILVSDLVFIEWNGCIMGITSTPHGYPIHTSRVSHAYLKGVTCMSHGYYKHTTWVSHHTSMVSDACHMQGCECPKIKNQCTNMWHDQGEWVGCREYWFWVTGLKRW